MIPRELQLIAQAVIDGDETAALAMFDALTEVRAKLGDGSEAQRHVFNQVMLACDYRVRGALRNAGINSLAELLSRTTDDLLLIRNFGLVSLGRIHAVLVNHGLTLRVDPKNLMCAPAIDPLTPDWTPFHDDGALPARWERVPFLASRHTLEETARILGVREGTKAHLELSRYWAWFSAPRRRPEVIQGY